MQQQLENMRKYFRDGHTRSYEFRIAQLKKLKQLILDHEEEINQALYLDLKKSKEEVWATEIGFVIAEINLAISQLQHWMQPRKVSTNLLNFPSRSYILPEPLGIVLIISPWNYPFQLLLKPLVGAIAAGNCMVLKSSEHAPATSTLMNKMITSAFENRFICFVEGDGAIVIPDMMNHFAFDHVLFTGSTAVGKEIYKMAAQHLVPVTLELGGKSPCVVEHDADLKVAARRIVFSKFSNCGQMCIAPDYVLVHDSIKDKFVEVLKQTIKDFFTDEPQSQEHYGKIINSRQFNRILNYLSQGKILHGGRFEAEHLYIEPTLIEVSDMRAAVMNEEIFGPVLPIIGFNQQQQALDLIEQHKNPLAFYVFTQSSKLANFWMQQVPAGGGCINNTTLHITNHELPFGGRGYSGIGSYQGKKSFETFSHMKSVLRSPTWFDPKIKYPPFKGKLGLFKKLIK
jgi:aldehyde dehydrogenase (NAD+)